MAVFYYLLTFVFGCTVGSFLGVVVDRLSSKEPFWKGRSHCDHCRHLLQPLDLIPVVSFFLIKRKCRYCHKKLSWFYPLIEFITGVSFLCAAIALQTGFSLNLYPLLHLSYYFLLISSLLVIFFADIRYGIIPFKAVAFALIIIFIWDFLLPAVSLTVFDTQFLNIFVSALGAGGFFFFLFAVTKGRGMGFGDVVYALLMGFILGFPKVILGLYIAFVSGAVISLFLVLLHKKKLRGGTIPFGPFLVLGTIVSLLWGDVLIQYFLRFLLL